MGVKRISISAFFGPFLLLSVLVASCNRTPVLFETIGPEHSGVNFSNTITISDSVNELDLENIYNGGGVGIGDFNNDSLPDLFFTGNMVISRLYLNRGDFRFEDITEKAGINTSGRWCRGVAVVDINGDGLQDLYVSATLRKKASDRINMLFINLGPGSDGVPLFRDEAAEYGLDDDSHTTQADFFDYDNDGDLDVYMVVNEISPRISPYLFRPVMKNGSNPSTGKLYRNDWSAELGHPFYTDVSVEAGIRSEGYGHSACITDINDDGWKDIWVSGDFITNDLLWINMGNGTFTDQNGLYFKHTSANSMGCDAGDINNDGREDYVTLDMNPEDNYRKKMMLSPISYQLFQNYDRFGYTYQYVRNTVQLNMGPSLHENDSTGLPVFGDISYYAGVEATDWSWIPLLTDFDNDGYRDLIINNGFPRDITDHDFATFRDKAYLVASKDQVLMQIPEVKLHNYAFRNNGDLTFTDVSHKWGFSAPTFSNGSAYSDLDRDGDADLVVNNINDKALIMRNMTRELNRGNSHWIGVRFRGPAGNPSGFGAKAELWYDKGKTQVWENNPYRGYLSTVEDIAHFGLGSTVLVDSVVIRWQGGRTQVFRNISSDRIITADISEAVLTPRPERPDPARASLFTELTRTAGIDHVDRETDFIDFNIQKLLPHKLSQYGPALASADLDGNGLDDIICGASAGYRSSIFLQQDDGTFSKRELSAEASGEAKTWDDAGILLFDPDGDGDQDIYIASGGYENAPGSEAYRDHLYINDGHGSFREAAGAGPGLLTSKSCVRASDIDNDGDPDLFIAGRVEPWFYPRPVTSYILRNDSEGGKLRFTDVTDEVAPGLKNIGLVCDALFTDYDNDGQTDLLLAGEWMPLTFFKNDHGSFTNATSGTGTGDLTGWWNSLTGGDFDNDGDIDYVAGNLGLNSYYRADAGHPASVYAADYDNNGSFDAFPALYITTSQADTIKRSFPAHGRDDAIKQMLGIRSRFQNYKSYASSTIEQILSPEQVKKSLILKACCFASSFFRNNGNGTFTAEPLPAMAQLSALNGMTADDFDGDGNLDLLINCNDWGTEVTVGRYDALNGLLLKGDGQGGFRPLSVLESGIFIPGDGKGLVSLRSSSGRLLAAAGQNRGPLKLFGLRKGSSFITALPGDRSAELTMADGRKRKTEFYHGSSFLSQSSLFLKYDENIKDVVITGHDGKQRTIPLKR